MQIKHVRMSETKSQKNIASQNEIVPNASMGQYTKGADWCINGGSLQDMQPLL